jgi:hypothetical protein
MSQFEENMEEIFDIDISPQNTNIVKEENNVSGEAESDYIHTRNNLYDLIEKGQRAVEGALEVAQESNHPRAYEVAVNAIKQVADMTDKLIDLQKKMKDLNKEDKKAGPSTVNNSIFFGSTADLQKMLKRGKVEEE